MKVRDIIKLVEADGWYVVTTRGSHRQYKHMSKVGRVTIAGHPSTDGDISTTSKMSIYATLGTQLLGSNSTSVTLPYAGDTVTFTSYAATDKVTLTITSGSVTGSGAGSLGRHTRHILGVSPTEAIPAEDCRPAVIPRSDHRVNLRL